MISTSTSIPGATLAVPDAELYYEVRGAGPLVVLVGAPMDANSFAPLADLLATEHTVLTTDPRGVNRSPLHGESSTPMMADYLAGDVIGAWKRFFAQANIQLPEGAIDAMFGGERDPRTVADERFWFEHEMRETIRWEPDLAALRDGSVRIVVGIGEESTAQLCERTSIALAEGLGVEPVRFTGGHIGFVEQPEPFAAVLRPYLRTVVDRR